MHVLDHGARVWSRVVCMIEHEFPVLDLSDPGQHVITTDLLGSRWSRSLSDVCEVLTPFLWR